MANNRVFDNILLRINGIIGRFSLRPYAKDAAERVRIRTRLGYGVQDGERGGKRERLKPLKPDYRIFRKKSKKTNRKLTTPAKSNLTLTGQLLDAIRGRVRGKTIEVYFKENRNDGVKNTDIRKGQAEQGRDFFELTDKEVKGLRNQIKKDLIKLLRKR